MNITQAIISHYQETQPQLQIRDNMLVLSSRGVAVRLEQEQVVILTDYHLPYGTKLLSILAIEPKTTLDQINCRRTWNVLFRGSRCRHFDYSDPRLFDILDEALRLSTAQSDSCVA